MGSKGPAADSAGPFAGLLLGGDDGSALVLAFLLGPDLDPTLALAAILAGAGILCARAGCFAFALVDARALDPFGRVLALLLLRVGGVHDEQRRHRGGNQYALRALHLSAPSQRCEASHHGSPGEWACFHICPEEATRKSTRAFLTSGPRRRFHPVGWAPTRCKPSSFLFFKPKATTRIARRNASTAP